MIAKSSGSWPHLQQRHAGVGLAGGELNLFTIQEERDAVGVGRHVDRRRGGRRVKKEGYKEEDLVTSTFAALKPLTNQPYYELQSWQSMQGMEGWREERTKGRAPRCCYGGLRTYRREVWAPLLAQLFEMIKSQTFGRPRPAVFQHDWKEEAGRDGERCTAACRSIVTSRLSWKGPA